MSLDVGMRPYRGELNACQTQHADHTQICSRCTNACQTTATATRNEWRIHDPSTVLLQYRLLEQAFGLHSNGYDQGCCAFHVHGARGGQCKSMDELLRRLPTSEWKLVYRSLILHSYLHCRYIIRSKPYVCNRHSSSSHKHRCGGVR